MHQEHSQSESMKLFSVIHQDRRPQEQQQPRFYILDDQSGGFKRGFDDQSGGFKRGFDDQSGGFKRGFEALVGSSSSSSRSIIKKQRAPAQPQIPPVCQVEGCNTDLSESKGYHRRHRVCEVHAKTPKNVVDGIEQRFCQQCSRFHILEEFDDGKRSCRKRLAGHNERRRKPSQPAEAGLSLGSCSSGKISIFPGDFKPCVPQQSQAAQAQQQQQEHLLDGSFLSSWPPEDRSAKMHHKLHEAAQIYHHDYHSPCTASLVEGGALSLLSAGQKSSSCSAMPSISSPGSFGFAIESAGSSCGSQIAMIQNNNNNSNSSQAGISATGSSNNPTMNHQLYRRPVLAESPLQIQAPFQAPATSAFDLLGLVHSRPQY